VKTLFLITPFLLLGCAAPYHHGSWTGNICITPGFNDDQTVLLYQATQEWKDRSDDNVNLNVSILNNHEENGCDAVVFPNVPPNSESGIGVTEYPSEEGYAVYIYIDPNLSIVDQLPDQENSNTFYDVSLHELGHYLGARHSPYCDDVMYWKVNAFYHLTDNDVNQLWHPYPIGKYDNLDYCLE
jgi:Matrixin